MRLASSETVNLVSERLKERGRELYVVRHRMGQEKERREKKKGINNGIYPRRTKEDFIKMV